MSELGRAMKSAREHSGYSLTRMAQVSHYSAAYLSLIENGKRRAAPGVVTAYEQALGVSIGDDPVRRAHEWLVAESPVVEHRRAGRRIGVGTVEVVEARVVELRRLDDVVAGGELLPVVLREWDSAVGLVREAAFSSVVRRRLLVAVAELAQLAGWVSGDVGRRAEAERLFLGGVGAAEEAGDRVLGAQLFSSLGYQCTNSGRHRDGVLLARTAVQGGIPATPVVRALFLDRLAWACAKSGDRDGARRALDGVEAAYERRSPDLVEPEWVYWFDRNEIDVMAGRCLIELGMPGVAGPLVEAAVARYPVERSREVAFYLTWLAEAHARNGERDAAADVFARAVEHAARMPSARSDERLRAVGEVIR
ncbi:helix-turn-helix transcriptional regulator [Actinosynnema sp. NPDC020468]|uniref:helix-turn-helix domain-containing protein n=1 Tax=Actinosynnema sp. NPDC020468 TaxID=3154488 RepID=UPI003401BFDD